MDSFESPSIPSAPAWRRALGGLETLVAAGILALSLMGFAQVPDTSLDGSWQEMLVYAHAHGLQFGRDIIFTWGPWGFLCSRYHLGEMGAPIRIAWEVGGNALIALSIAWLCRPLPAWRRLLFMVLVVGLNWIFQDLAYFVVITLVALSGLMRRNASAPALSALCVLLGFLAQIKFTYFLLAGAAAGASCVLWLLRGSRARCGAIAAAFTVSVLTWWVLAGQNLDNLYPYVKRSLEIAAGYGDAMGQGESWQVFACGVACALACLAFLRSVWTGAEDRPFAAAGGAFLAFAMLLAWKEGFTRADGHVLGFFGYVVMVSPLASGFLLPARRVHWFDFAFLMGLAGIASFATIFILLAPQIIWQRIRGNAEAMPHLGSIPGDWQKGYEAACAQASLPRIKAAVGSGGVDVYDFNIGSAILNGMNIDSRPIFQSYTAYTPSLEGWNLRFYQSSRAPEFLLWKGEGMDNRYPGQDDAMMIARLPGHYEPMFEEKGFWLFRRLSPLGSAADERVLVRNVTVRIGEEIAVPSDLHQAIWLRLRAVPNGLGKVRAALYRPAQLDIVVTPYGGPPRSWRLVPRVAEYGFILAPTLADGADLAALTRGRALSWVRSFHFDAPDGQAEFWSHMDVSIFREPGLPVATDGSEGSPPK
jgi:hypothetical protein